MTPDTAAKSGIREGLPVGFFQVERDVKKKQTEMPPNLKSANVLRPIPARVR